MPAKLICPNSSQPNPRSTRLEKEWFFTPFSGCKVVLDNRDMYDLLFDKSVEFVEVSNSKWNDKSHGDLTIQSDDSDISDDDAMYNLQIPKSEVMKLLLQGKSYQSEYGVHFIFSDEAKVKAFYGEL